MGGAEILSAKSDSDEVQSGYVLFSSLRFGANKIIRDMHYHDLGPSMLKFDLL